MIAIFNFCLMNKVKFSALFVPVIRGWLLPNFLYYPSFQKICHNLRILGKFQIESEVLEKFWHEKIPRAKAQLFAHFLWTKFETKIRPEGSILSKTCWWAINWLNTLYILLEQITHFFEEKMFENRTSEIQTNSSLDKIRLDCFS